MKGHHGSEDERWDGEHDAGAGPPAKRSVTRPKSARLPRLDLNLLFVFEAVMQERSVTRAAHRPTTRPEPSCAGGAGHNKKAD